MDKKQEEARQQILDLVADYCENYHIKNKKEFEPGDRIPYASRVYDANEMVNLVAEKGASHCNRFAVAL